MVLGTDRRIEALQSPSLFLHFAWPPVPISDLRPGMLDPRKRRWCSGALRCRKSRCKLRLR